MNYARFGSFAVTGAGINWLAGFGAPGEGVLVLGWG